MRRLLKIAIWVTGLTVLLVVALGGAVMVAGNTDPGRAWIERLTFRLTAGYVKLSGLGGAFPTQLSLRELQLIDHDGAWLVANDISLTWSPLRLLERRIEVATLRAARLHIERGPVSDKPSSGKAWVPYIDVGRFSLSSVELGAPLVGTPVTLSAQGNFRLRSLEDANGDLIARRVGNDGEYTLHFKFDPRRMDASLQVHEPASGPLENLLTLPGLGALTATATLAGPHNAETVDVALDAGDLHARAQGRIDLTQRSADLEYSLNSPALAPRADVAWNTLSLQGNWHGSVTAPNADGKLVVDNLRIAGNTRIDRLTANLTADTGHVAMHAVVNGLEIPGPAPRLLAKEPVRVDGSLQLNDPSRPLQLTALHPLFALQAHADTAGQLKAVVELKLADVTPFAALVGQDVQGSAAINARWAHRPGEDALSLDAKFGLTGGAERWIGMVGPSVAVQLTGSLSDAVLKIDNVRIAGHALTLAASGSARRATPAPSGTKPDSRGAAAFIKDLQARWQLDVSDLAALSSDLAGSMKVSGRLNGSPTALTADADVTSSLSVRGSPSGIVDATVHASGIPATPSVTLRAHGMVDGAPLSLDAALDRSDTRTFRLAIHQAEWRSAHIDGDMTADAALTQSHGQLNLRMAEIGDLNRLLGTSLSGRVEGVIGFVPAQGHTQAQVRLEGKGLAIAGFAGDVHLQAQGVFDALALKLSAEVPDLYGSAATLASAADLNIDKRLLHLTSASMGYRGETLRLLAPAEISFGTGVSVDDLKLGVQEAVLEVKGQVSPMLDLRASLNQVKPGLINVFSPGLLADGLIEARVRLQGSASSPTGRVRLDGTAIRFADDAATGLPALDLHARADLAGDSAAIDAKLSAGASSQLTASGKLPLAAGGPVDVKIGGKLDLGLANPLLEARGMRATGELTADATVTGTVAAPQVGGGLTLAQGSLRDFGRGVNLSDITAAVVGNEGGLQIKSFNATAASGNIAMSGTFGVLQPGLPVDLKITAKNAQPIASNIVTANLDADVQVRGTARKRIDVSGTVHVNRAVIGIPDSLPPDVAILDVRRRGKAASAATSSQLVIGIDLAIVAPQQILVQGRGLDAEMGGTIKLSGTTDALVASGGLDLQRGSFSLGGNKLTFSSNSRVSFDGMGLQKKIDPALDFTASTTVNETTATLHITGVADAPKFEFTSSPPQGPDETMALLLFGKPANQLTALELAQVAAALASAGGIGGSGLNPLVKLQRSLGLDRLSVGSNTNTATGTDTSGAAFAAGRYVSRRVYVEGRQTTTGTSQVQVDVDLTKHLKLQTRLGNGTAVVQGTTPDNDPGSSMGLSYQFEY
jgi:translocation and assembly module TamB